MTSSPKRDFSTYDGTSRSWWRPARRIGSILLFGLGGVGLATSVGATSFDQALPATPLVLKDGRIAEVSVHTIPFPDDAVAPASKVSNRLDAFTQSIATDCFLTAQVIGHVDKSEISGRETADIHRLARARADTIQTSLTENGLPAVSIASVWDWRFMVQEARVTLWVFRLIAGDDCEGAPLGSEAEGLVAEVDAPSAPAEEPAGSPAAPAVVAKAKEPTPTAPRQEVIPAARPKNPSTAKPQSQVVTTPLPDAPPGPERIAEDDVAVDRAPVAKGPDVTSEKTVVAALSTDPKTDKKGSIGLVDGGVLEIVFATNSSFFPVGAGDQLRAFMKTLDKDKTHVLRILTSVDGDAGVAGASSSDEAARYNAWLAERRFKRVEAWLLKNADGRKLTLEPSLIENDGSRRVRVEANPLG